MNDLEKAIRYLCLFETDEEEAMISRYNDINAMIRGDEELIQKNVKRYESMVDLFCS